jgi:hypothetical protein
LEKYYKRRKAIENSFSWQYNMSCFKRAENLTKKYAKIINDKTIKL